MRRSSRLVLLGVSAIGVSVPVPPVEAEERPVIVDLQPRNCIDFPSAIQHPLLCGANCPGLPGCSLDLCARTDCGHLWCWYDCTP